MKRDVEWVGCEFQVMLTLDGIKYVLLG